MESCHRVVRSGETTISSKPPSPHNCGITIDHSVLAPPLVAGQEPSLLSGIAGGSDSEFQARIAELPGLDVGSSLAHSLKVSISSENVSRQEEKGE